METNNNRYKIKSGSFFRDVLKLSAGTTLALAIPIAISPILTRIYTPKDFGIFALFSSLTAVFGSISCLRYEHAIMLPEKDEDALNIVALSFLITGIISLMVFIAVLLFVNQIVSILNTEDIKLWLYISPLIILLIGIYTALRYYFVRLKAYTCLAQTEVLRSAIGAATQLGLGLLKLGAEGLISGYAVSQLVGDIRFALHEKIIWKRLNAVKMKTIIHFAKRYVDFAKFSVWGIFSQTLSLSVINISLSSIFGLVILGNYALAERILTLPLNLIIGSVGDVFFRNATEERKLTGKATETFKSTLQKLAIGGFLFFLGAYFLSEKMFVIIFGDQWIIAGKYAKILSLLYASRFVVASLTLVCSVFEKQKIGLIWQVILLLVTVLTILLTVLFSLDVITFLKLLSYSLTACYLLFLVVLWRICKAN